MLVCSLQLRFYALADCLGHKFCEKLTLGKGLPALSIDPRLILVVLPVVTHDVVAVRIVFVELIVGRLLGTFLLLQDDVVRIEHGLVLALRVQSELLFTARICVLRAQLDDGLRELV